LQLGATQLDREVSPDAFAERERRDGLHAAAALELSASAAKPVECGETRLTALLGHREGCALVLVIDERFGLEQIRERDRDMTDFAAFGIGVPHGDLLVDARWSIRVDSGLRGDLEYGVCVFRDCEQPIDADPGALGRPNQCLGAWKATGVG